MPVMHPIFRQFALGLWSVLPGNYSGITALPDSTYAIVDDKAVTDGFSLLRLDFNPRTGRLRHATMTEPSGTVRRRSAGEKNARDGEGICYCPWRNSIFISGENDQQILEYSLDGEPTGHRLAVPEDFRLNRIQSNRGFEALTCDTSRHLIWTTTESPLPADTAEFGQSLRIIAFGEDLQPCRSFRYPLDGPFSSSRHASHKTNIHSFRKTGTSLYGVPSLLTMEDGRLLILEREVYMPAAKTQTQCTIRIYIVDPDHPDTPKELLASVTTHPALAGHDLSNFEGMCWGPVLRDGRRTILLIADSQAAYGNALYHLRDYLGVLILPILP